MSRHVWICFLLVWSGFEDGTEAMDEARRLREIQKIPTGFGVYNDRGEIVMITNARSLEIEYEGEIMFNLYTQKNPNNGQELRATDSSSLTSSHFDANKETYIITHGWMNSGNSLACTLIRNAILAHSDSNVIVVDWSVYSMTINYIDASDNVETAGSELSELIKFLYKNGLKPDKTTLIGHSLGAHVMGIAGYKVRPKVKMIIGLDPALPMFGLAEAGEALSKEDAEHVQIIHTNAGVLGYVCPSGHSDFFPNGGVSQIDCCAGSLLECVACSHGMAYQFFAASIIDTFVATQCDNYEWYQSNYCGARAHTASMGGLQPDNSASGTYYLMTTNGVKPGSRSVGKTVPNLKELLSSSANAVCRGVKLLLTWNEAIQEYFWALAEELSDVV